jgi:hypothetical protein
LGVFLRGRWRFCGWILRWGANTRSFNIPGQFYSKVTLAGHVVCATDSIIEALFLPMISVTMFVAKGAATIEILRRYGSSIFGIFADSTDRLGA